MIFSRKKLKEVRKRSRGELVYLQETGKSSLGRSPSKRRQKSQEREKLLKIGNFEVAVLVHNRRVREFTHDGEIYIEGRDGQSYKVRVINSSDRRILAVVSVDGLSVMDGKEARLRSGGYVIDPHGHIDIPGWRLDNSAVAKFVFGDADASYAAKMGKRTNIGVIGCAIFEEKPIAFKLTEDFWREIQRRPILPRRRPGVEPRIRYHGGFGGDQQPLVIGAATEHLSSGVQNMGTGFGPKQDHKVVDVDFDPQEKAATVFQIVYDTRDGLEARGVSLKGPVKIALNAFPGDKGCPPPAGWKYQ